MIARLLAAVLALALAGCATVPEQPPVARTIEWAGLAAEGLPEQRVTVWLPLEYAAQPGRRFPVLYMWDGQNLFDPAQTHYGKAWMVQDVLGRMVAAGEAEPHIVVGVWSPPGKDRYRVYLPQTPAEAMPDAVRAAMAEEAGGPFAADRQLGWVAKVLKLRVDRTFRTRTAPRDTTVVGASMGGLMACYAAIERPDVFGRAGCVSIPFAPVGGDVAAAHEPGIERAWAAYLTTALGRPGGRRIWMDHGTAGMDGTFGPWQDAVAGDFAAAGWAEGRDFTARSFAGAEHDENFWHARMPEMLA